MREQIISAVKTLLAADNTGHGYEHVERVYELALRMAAEEKADEEIVGLAALLHDVDDYKLFGAESAAELSNAKKIMAAAKVTAERQEKVCDIIRNMGITNRCREFVRVVSRDGLFPMRICWTLSGRWERYGAWRMLWRGVIRLFLTKIRGRRLI